MKIIYSPEFDSKSYLNFKQRKGKMLGLKVCGSMELLSELELRSGIVALEKTEAEQLVAFHNALSNNVKGTIFEGSFTTDGVGVARQLMAWTDNLMMAGWTPDTIVESDKLKALASFVKGVDGTHVAQRWRNITTYLKDHTIFQKDDVIEIHTEELIPAVIKSTLEQLGKQATVEYIHNEGELTTNFSVYHFKTRAKAHQWYHSQPTAIEGVDVTISSDNCMLNDMAIAMGRPTVNSKSIKSNPQLLQMFKLGMSLFARPLNVYNLLSYLQVPGNPLGGVSYALAKVLTDEGGIHNEKWQKTIDEYDFKDENGKDKRNEKLAFIAMLDKSYAPEKIPVDDVKEYSGNLAHWCDMMMHSREIAEERKEQLSTLASYCRSLCSILPNGGHISSDNLKSQVEGIYRPRTFSHMNAQKDSPDTITSVTQLVDHADSVCWLGCVGGTIPAYPFEFLNTSECEGLSKLGVNILSKTEFYKTYHQVETDALKNAGRLILVTWEFDGNARQEEHPFVTDMKHQYGKDWNDHVAENEAPNLRTIKGTVTNLEPQDSYKLSNDLSKIKRDKEESQTSISALIQHPFDYTTDYLLKLKEPKVGQLSDLDTTKGLVAHLFVEKLVDKFGESMATEFNKMKTADIDQLIEEALQQKGAILLLPEYKIDCQQFKAILKESVKVLTSIIQELELKPVGCEVEMKVEFDTIGDYGGSIDMVLKNKHEKIVIFDFKWSEGKNYQTKLEENKSIQLELYKQAAAKHYEKTVAGVAYYLFPKMTLYTTDFAESEHIRHVDVKEEAASRTLFEEIKNSYKYRRTEELDKGVIEDGELTAIADIPYAKASSDTSPHFPLEPDYNKKELKGCPYTKKDKPPFAKKKADWQKKQDPKEIKTTHPILKGRLL